MTALLWLIQKIAPITNIIGLFVLLSELAYGDIGIGTHVYVLAGGLALAGFILGFTNWALDVPPKFFQPNRGCNFSTTAWATPYRRRAMARLYTPSSSSCCRSSWRGWRLWRGNGDGTVSATILKAP